ncbi:MAG: FHA domain-containing protein, partial [Candidatus Abyssubacteria bacterium]|nr:FHA domain-containing protein [Candidatus Abyssubacteria bacterium]
MPRLTAMEGPHKGAFCELAPTEMLIGRMKTCPICLYDEEVSRKHASIVPEGESLIIRDLGSRNGTFVNNDRIKTKSLTDGDTIRIGCSVLLFTSEVGESAADEMTLVATVVSEDADGVMSDFAQQVVAGRSDLALIYRIAETVLREDNVENVLEKLLENLMERFSPAGAFAFLLNSGTNELELVTSRSQTETLPISRTIIQDCFDKKEGILAKNPRADQRFSRMESVWFHNITSALCAPIGRVGVINLCHTSSRRRFTERNLKLLSVIAS